PATLRLGPLHILSWSRATLTPLPPATVVQGLVPRRLARSAGSPPRLGQDPRRRSLAGRRGRGRPARPRDPGEHLLRVCVDEGALVSADLVDVDIGEAEVDVLLDLGDGLVEVWRHQNAILEVVRAE